MTMTTYVLENQSTYTDAAHGGPLDDAILAAIAWAAEWSLCGAVDAAGTKQAPAHTVCGQYGGQAKCMVGEPNAALDAGQVACIIRDEYPKQPGAGGWHTDENGRPAIFISRQYSTSLTKGAFCLSELVTHEINETEADLGANLYSDREDGTEEAFEDCDRVEGDVATAPNGVDVSNFLLKTAFIPGAEGPFDLKGTLTGQYDKTDSGYAILRKDGAYLPDQAKVSHPSQAEKLAHPGSRLARRIAKLAAQSSTSPA